MCQTFLLAGLQQIQEVQEERRSRALLFYRDDSSRDSAVDRHRSRDERRCGTREAATAARSRPASAAACGRNCEIEACPAVSSSFSVVVALGGDGDDRAAARLGFLDVAEHLLEHVIVWRDGDDRHLLVDERDRAVLHLAGRIAFGVDVGDFLQLQRAFERDRIVDAAAEIEEVGRLWNFAAISSICLARS